MFGVALPFGQVGYERTSLFDRSKSTTLKAVTIAPEVLGFFALAFVLTFGVLKSTTLKAVTIAPEVLGILALASVVTFGETLGSFFFPLFFFGDRPSADSRHDVEALRRND